MHENDQYPQAKEALSKWLEAHNMRKTPERYAILRRALLMPSHFSIDAIHRALEEEDSYHVARSTVYATVELLCRIGLLRCHHIGPERDEARYESALANHFHLVCNRCGKIEEEDDDELTRLLSKREYPAFDTQYFSIYVYGVCADCAASSVDDNKNINKSVQ